MRLKIGRKILDTEKAVEVGKQTVSFFGDPRGFEEIMFKQGKDTFFLLVNGGPQSQYTEERIIPLDLQDAKEWLLRITGEDHAMSLLPEVKKSKSVKPAVKRAASASNTASSSKTVAVKAAAGKSKAAKK